MHVKDSLVWMTELWLVIDLKQDDMEYTQLFFHTVCVCVRWFGAVLLETDMLSEGEVNEGIIHRYLSAHYEWPAAQHPSKLINRVKHMNA